MMRLSNSRWYILFVSLFVFGASAFTASSQAADDAPSEAVEETSLLAVSHVRPDGTIEVMIRLVYPGDAIGETMWTYAPNDPKYSKVLDYLGHPAPGEYVSHEYWPYELVPDSD